MYSEYIFDNDYFEIRHMENETNLLDLLLLNIVVLKRE